MSDATTVLGASTVAAPTVDPDTIRAFLIGMYGFEAKGWLTPTRKIVRAKRSYAAAESVPAVDIDTAVDWLARNAARADTWCGVCPRGTKPPGAKRGGKRTVLSIPSVWLDVDFIDPGHKNNEGLPADLDAALAIVHAMPLAPTVVISTGGGVQAHWCFHAPIQLDGAPPGFAQLPEAWVTFAQSLAGPGQVDSVGDLARMLRVPGTLNHKLDHARPVTIIEADWTRRYTPEAIAAVIPIEHRESATRRVGPKEVRPGAAPRVDADGFSTGDLRPPITRYNERTNICDLIEADGASYSYADAEGRDHYVREGKDPEDGVSGNVLDGTLYVHSEAWVANGVTLEKGPYDAAQYTIETRYGGDSRAAARVWAKEHKQRDFEELAEMCRRSGSREDEKPGNSPPELRDESQSQHGDDGFTVTGGVFLFDESTELALRWGRNDEVLWAAGESLMLAGTTGVGKTTLANQLVAALVGLLDGEVLGLPVVPAKRVLYLAMDRPSQIRRAMRRLLGPEHRAVLDARLVVRRAPLPQDLGKNPELLVALAREYDCDVVFIDSLKDAAVKLTDDEVGGNVNRAIQWCNAENIDVCALHHQRKPQDGAKPKTIADVYGSTWLTAGTGSVVLLWGEPGSELIELIHLKQPAETVGPWKLEHDHHAGTTTVIEGFDALAYLRLRGAEGASLTEAAQAEHGTPVKPSSAQGKQTERRLKRLVRADLADYEPQVTGDDGRFQNGRYYVRDRSVDALVNGAATGDTSGDSASGDTSGDATGDDR